ncbi:MAG: HGGxSTG domain-containing protein [Blastocatellia bacterium]
MSESLERKSKGEPCGAMTRSGQPCHSPAMPNGRCRMHGGTTPSGVASPHFIHGGYSKHLPLRLAARINELTADPLLLELRGDVAVITHRLYELYGRLYDGESGALWQELQDALKELRLQRASKNTARMVLALTRIEQLIERGASDQETWAEINQQTLLRTRMIEAERRRLHETGQMIPAERVMAFAAALTEAVRRHVTDRKTLEAISAEFGKITGSDDQS